MLDWPSIQYSSYPTDYGSNAVKMAVKAGLQAASVPTIVSPRIALVVQGVSKLIPSTSYGSLAKAILSEVFNQ